MVTICWCLGTLGGEDGTLPVCAAGRLGTPVRDRLTLHLLQEDLLLQGNGPLSKGWFERAGWVGQLAAALVAAAAAAAVATAAAAAVVVAAVVVAAAAAVVAEP